MEWRAPLADHDAGPHDGQREVVLTAEGAHRVFRLSLAPGIVSAACALRIGGTVAPDGVADIAQVESRDGAHVHQVFDPAHRRSFSNIAGAIDDAVAVSAAAPSLPPGAKLTTVRQPASAASRLAGARHVATEAADRIVGEEARHGFDVARQDRDRPAGGRHRAHDVTSDETGAANDQHVVIPRQGTRRARMLAGAEAASVSQSATTCAPIWSSARGGSSR